MAAVLLVAVCAGVLLLEPDRGGPAASDPERTTSVLPKTAEPASPGAVQAYLRNEGSLVTAFRYLSAPLVDLRSVSDPGARLQVCQEVAARLNQDVDSAALLSASGAIPDAVLAELAVNDRTARSTALVSCGQRDQLATDEALRTVEAIDTLFTQRLGEL